MKRLEKHPAASNEACLDCGTPLVLIGNGEDRARDTWASECASGSYWSWYQCPYCGLYVRVTLFDGWLESTLDYQEVDIHHRLAPDPFQPSEGYRATWPTSRRCLACQGEYLVQTIRVWLRQDNVLIPKTETTNTRLTGDIVAPRSFGRFARCQCEYVEETRGSLEEALEAFPDGCILLIPQRYMDERMWAAKYLITQCGSLVDTWPHQLHIAEALATLRAYGPDPDYPPEPIMLAAWSPSAKRGTIRPLYESRPGRVWAEVFLP